MTWIDVTLPIRVDMPVFEGDPAPAITQLSSIASGAACNLSSISMSLHTGTHVDAPRHFIVGAGGVETLPLAALMGECVVVDATQIARPHISAADVERLVPPDARRVLFKTASGGLWRAPSFSRDFVAIEPAAAQALVGRGAVLVGIDYMSVAPFDDPAPTHIAFLAAGVAVLEGVDLRDIEPGSYELVCLPLLVAGADGAPARVLLRPLPPA